MAQALQKMRLQKTKASLAWRTRPRRVKQAWRMQHQALRSSLQAVWHTQESRQAMLLLWLQALLQLLLPQPWQHQD